jgi:hypothetical protein
MAGATDTLTGRRENARIEPDWYSICGLPVRSEVVLPLPPARPPEGTTPAWTIRYGEAAQRLKKPRWNWPAIPQSGRPVATSPDDGTTTFYHHIQKGADGVWFWWDGLATAHVSPDARDVAVYLDSDPDERLLGLLLAGPFAAVIFGQLGYPTLHASAIATPAGAVVFLGRKGQGKSTMAAAFLRRGDALLTDDMLLLRAESDGVCGVPGPPHMKLWRPTAEHTLGLAVDSLPNVVGTMEKKLLWIDGEYSMTRQPARIRALYVLDRYEPQ